MRRLRSVELQVCRYRVVDRFHFHGYCRLLCVCHLSLLNGSHDCVLGYSVRKSELIEICLVLGDAESESLVALCILCVEVGEVDLLLLDLRVLPNMDSELCELLCGFPLAAYIQRDSLLLRYHHHACDVRRANVELRIVVLLVDEHFLDDCAV